MGKSFFAPDLTLQQAKFHLGFFMKQLTVFQHSLFGARKQQPAFSTSKLVDRTRQPQRAQVETWYKTYHQHLCGWLQTRYGKSRTDAEEVTQKVFTKLLEMDSLKHIENPKAFIYTMAVNFALLNIRSRTTSQRYIDSQLQTMSENVEEITPERIYSSEVTFQQLLESMERLTVKQRQLLHLSRIEGKTYEQINQQMGWSLADISRQISQAMKTMRQEFNARSVSRDAG